MFKAVAVGALANVVAATKVKVMLGMARYDAELAPDIVNWTVIEFPAAKVPLWLNTKYICPSTDVLKSLTLERSLFNEKLLFPVPINVTPIVILSIGMHETALMIIGRVDPPTGSW